MFLLFFNYFILYTVKNVNVPVPAILCTEKKNKRKKPLPVSTVWIVSIWTVAGRPLLFHCTASSPSRVSVQHSVMNFPVPLYCLSLLQQQEPMQKNRARICRITMVMKTKVFSTVNRDGAWRLSLPLLSMSVSHHLESFFSLLLVSFWFVFSFKNLSSITFLC